MKTGTELIAEERARQIHNHPPLPWWRKDKHGWPIETFKGEPIKSAVRLVCQNLRKVTG